MVSFEEIQAAYYMVAATGVLVAAAYYVQNLRLNERIRRRDMVFQRLNVNMIQWYNILYDVLRMVDWETLEDFRKKYDRWSNPEAMAKMMYIFNHYNSLGILVRNGIVDALEVYQLYAPSTIINLYNKFRPFLDTFPHEYMSGFRFLADDARKRYPEEGLFGLTRSLEERVDHDKKLGLY